MVFRHHHWPWQILHSHSLTPNDDPCDTVPTAANIPRIIRLFHQISTDVDKHVLIHNEIRGAAWVITYACTILGFNVCA